MFLFDIEVPSSDKMSTDAEVMPILPSMPICAAFTCPGTETETKTKRQREREREREREGEREREREREDARHYCYGR
jgi:hypothetical protein